MCGEAPPANTTSKTTTSAPEYLQPSILSLVKRSSDLSNRKYQQYNGQQVAPLTQQHNQALGLIQNRATNGSPLMTNATNQTNKTLAGGYMGQGAYKNPYANMNTATKNSMAGVDNKYLNQVINNTNQDVTRAFTNSTMPQTDASFARSGAFGGSAWQQANSENNRQMASELAKNTSNLRYQDYSTQQGLAENYANRQSQSMQNQQQYGQQYANQQQQAFDAERQRQMSSVGQGQQLSNQSYTDAQNLLGAGDVRRDYSQSMNNIGYQNFMNQQNWPLQNLDILANAIRTSMGGGGSSVSQSQLPGINKASSMFGGAAAGGALGSALSNGSGYGAAGGAGLGALASLLG